MKLVYDGYDGGMVAMANGRPQREISMLEKFRRSRHPPRCWMSRSAKFFQHGYLEPYKIDIFCCWIAASQQYTINNSLSVYRSRHPPRCWMSRSAKIVQILLIFRIEN